MSVYSVSRRAGRKQCDSLTKRQRSSFVSARFLGSRRLTHFTGGSSPSGSAGTIKVSGVRFGAGAAVLAGRRGAQIVHHLAIESGKAFRTLAQILVRRRILARAAVQTRLVSAAVVEICKYENDTCHHFILPFVHVHVHDTT